MTEIWNVTEKSEVWMKDWIGYNQKGKSFGGCIIVINGSPELIEAIKEAFKKTESKKSK